MDFIKKLVNHLSLPKEAETVIDQTLKTISDSAQFRELSHMIESSRPFGEILTKIREYSVTLDVHEYTLTMVLLIANAHICHQRYLDNGIDEQIFWDTIMDLKYKIQECKNVYHVWGIFVFEWYQIIFETKLFKLGRLEYHIIPLKNGEPIVNIHIPSCGSLKHNDVLESYKMARAFFGNTHGNMTAFTCGSYLLFPEYRKAVFPEGSNTYLFAEDFHMLRTTYTEEFGNAWRVFSKDYDGDTTKLPADTSMQRAFIRYLNNGGKSGSGRGAFLFDGETIYKEEAEIFREYL